jgi:hypothetical protein
MTKKDWPYRVIARLQAQDIRPVLTWLHEDGHVLHETVKFGKHHTDPATNIISQVVVFKDPNKAMLFKLTWGGKK